MDYFAIAKLDVDVSNDFNEMIENDEVYQIMSGGTRKRISGAAAGCEKTPK